MQVYERRTEEVISLFLNRSISFPECIAALDATLAAFMPRMTHDQIDHVRVVMLANNEIVVKEMERRDHD